MIKKLEEYNKAQIEFFKSSLTMVKNDKLCQSY